MKSPYLIGDRNYLRPLKQTDAFRDGRYWDTIVMSMLRDDRPA